MQRQKSDEKCGLAANNAPLGWSRAFRRFGGGGKIRVMIKMAAYLPEE
jgi:hypothetical protein